MTVIDTPLTYNNILPYPYETFIVTDYINSPRRRTWIPTSFIRSVQPKNQNSCLYGIL